MWRRPGTIISDYQQSSQNPNQNENQNCNNDNNSYNQNQASISSRLSCSETMHLKEDIMEEKRKRRGGEELFRVGSLKVCVVKHQQNQHQHQRQQQRQQLKLSNMMKKKRPFGLHGNWLSSRQQQVSLR